MVRFLLLGVGMLASNPCIAGKSPEQIMTAIHNSKRVRTEVVMDRPIAELAGLIEQEARRCSGDQNFYAVIGSPVSVSVNTKLEQGRFPDGTLWFAYVASSSVNFVWHWPLEMRAIDESKTSVVMYDVKPRKVLDRQNKLLGGGYFCRMKKRDA